MPSGTRSSSYRGPKPDVTFWRANSFRARNFTNPESCGFLLTDHAFSTTEDNQRSAAWNAAIGSLLLESARSEADPPPRHASFPAGQLSCKGAIA